VSDLRPRSLIWATNIEVLPADHVVRRGRDHSVISSPSNPGHWWGNLLLFDAAPGGGDGERWEREFVAAFEHAPGVLHRTFGWDDTSGALGAAREEFVARGYQLEETVGLAADASRLRPHPRASSDVEVRALDPRPGRDEQLWAGVIEIMLAGYTDPLPDTEQRDFCQTRQRGLRELFMAGHGAWYVALADDGEVAGSLGIVVTGGRGRYQTVDTAEPHRRRGVCSRLVVSAARHSRSEHGARSFVIGADPHYHALGLYESLGFEAVERVAGVCKPAPGDRREHATEDRRGDGVADGRGDAA
jgi:ribosomal protein S18 acetylase RimI-like enzyme